MDLVVNFSIKWDSLGFVGKTVDRLHLDGIHGLVFVKWIYLAFLRNPRNLCILSDILWPSVVIGRIDLAGICWIVLNRDLLQGIVGKA